MNNLQSTAKDEVFQLDKTKALKIVYMALAMLGAPTADDKLNWLCKKFSRPEINVKSQEKRQEKHKTLNDVEIKDLINKLLKSQEVQRDANGNLICADNNKLILKDLDDDNDEAKTYWNAMLEQLDVIEKNINIARDDKNFQPVRFKDDEWSNLFSAINLLNDLHKHQKAIDFLKKLTGSNQRRKWRDALLDSKLDQDRMLTCLDLGLGIACKARDKAAFRSFLKHFEWYIACAMTDFYSEDSAKGRCNEVVATSKAIKDILTRDLISASLPKEDLKQILVENFNKSEWNDVLYDLKLTSEQIGGETITDLIRNSLSYFERHKTLASLKSILKKKRPLIDWGLAF